MKLVIISDTHGRHHGLKLPKGDVLVHAGDVTHRGSEAEYIDFLQWFSSRPHTHKVFIAGNHDFFLERAGAELIRSRLPEGIHYLCNSGCTLEGIRFWGSPYTPWFFNWAFNLQRGAALRDVWQKIPEDTNVLITHGPPYGHFDQVHNGNRAGCVDLLRRVRELRPNLHLFGHIHESRGRARKDGTIYINASLLNDRYELEHAPFIVEINE